MESGVRDCLLGTWGPARIGGIGLLGHERSSAPAAWHAEGTVHGRMIVIGLDGGTLDSILPWAEEGSLPGVMRQASNDTGRAEVLQGARDIVNRKYNIEDSAAEYVDMRRGMARE